MASTIVGTYPCARTYADTYAMPMRGVASLLTERAVETIGPRTSATRSFEARGVKVALIMTALATRRSGLNRPGACWIVLLRQPCRSPKDRRSEGKPRLRPLCERGERDSNDRTAVDEPDVL